MNSVPGLFWPFVPSTVSYSVTPSSVTNVFSDCPTSDLLSIRCISAKYVPFENTCAYWLPSNDFTWPSVVSVSHMPMSCLVWNTLSALYCLARGINDDQVNLCVVLDSVYFSCYILIFHRSLSSPDDTVEWHPLHWNVFACGTYFTVIFNYDEFLDGIEATLTLPIIQLVMSPMSYTWSTEYL